MYPETFQLIEEKMQKAVFPGAVLSFVENEETEVQVMGNAQVEPTIISMQEDTISIQNKQNEERAEMLSRVLGMIQSGE